MLHLKVGLSAQNIIVTLDEKRTLPAPIYRFTCTHVVTKEVVTFDINSTADLSTFKQRYNEFEINPSVLFLGATPGQWNYVVTELVSNLEMENGKLLLNKAVDFAFTGYSPATTYNGYGG